MVAAVVVVGMLVVGGCAPKAKSSTASKATGTKKVATSSTSTKKVSSEESSTTTTEAKADEPGPITTPASGSKTRNALLSAARKKLGSSTDLTVHQLYMQDGTAIGDLQPASGSRAFFAWVKTDGTWTATERWAFGSASANAVSVARALPDFTDELIGKINFKLAKPKTSGTGSASSMKSSLTTAVKAWTKSAMDGQGQPYKVTLIKVAKDSKGTWWGRAVVAPTGEYERLQFWAKYSGSNWSGDAQDPEPPAPKTYFPSSVLSDLGF
jgi:outer membrane murein-binding lipoprotein Lpp